MEHVNSTATATTKQQQQQAQNSVEQEIQQQQQQQKDFQQQFCLRWHNHQTSLLSTLPVLLDQSHLTDVTISAEGKNLQAHRIVLSACSSFFLELFRNLDAANHPVIIIPGASFAAIDALLTFMYSGEVNVYEEQIPNLLSLAETLGIKGLADVQNNLQKSPKLNSQKTECFSTTNDELEVHKANEIAANYLSTEGTISPTSTVAQSPTSPLPPTPTNHLPIECPLTLHELSLQTPFRPLASPLLSQKLPPNLENFFLKSLQLYPNLLPQPLNFSQNALNKTNEFLAKYQQHLYPNAFTGILPNLSSTLSAAAMAAGVAVANTCQDNNNNNNKSTTTTTTTNTLNNDDNYASKRFCGGDRKLPHLLQQQQQQQQKDIKRIDKIVENLRCGNKTLQEMSTNQQQQQQQQNYASTGVTTQTQASLSHMATRSTYFNDHQQQQQRHAAAVAAAAAAAYMASEEHLKQHKQKQQMNEQLSNLTPHSADNSPSPLETLPSLLMSSVGANANHTVTMSASTATSVPTKTYASNSKLYATCFICHKQLSNQYNLRVHLETHQNVR